MVSARIQHRSRLRRGEPTERAPVLHVSQPASEGVGNYVRDLCIEQRARGRPVAIACPPGSPLADDAASAGVRFFPWVAGRHPGFGMARELHNLAATVGTARPAIVHLHSSKAGAVGRLAVRGRLPTVYQPHAWPFDAASPPLDTIALRWERTAARWAHAIVTVSAGERAEAERNGIRAGGTMVTIPNPVDPQRYRPPRKMDHVGGLLRRTLGLTDEPLAACPGRLCHQKGQDLLLQAWPLVRTSVPRARLLLIGDGPLRPDLEAMADDSVFFLGDRADMAEILRSVQVVVMPSRWEGMSLAMLEAMASGRPVVVSDVGGAKETVGQGAGALIPVGDIGHLAAATVERLDDPVISGREGRIGRRLMIEGHVLSSVVDALDGVYREVTGRRELPADGSGVADVRRAGG